MMADGDRLDPAILDRYEVPAPAPDLADRFMARLAREPARRARRTLVIAGAAALAAAATLIVVLAWPAAAPAAGTVAATERTTVRLATRGVAVAEPGARLAWQVAAHGAARVHQDGGEVFYRVDRGAAFVVTTPIGDVSVRGTCFRVELEPTLVVVTVYEGAVEVTTSLGRIALTAGERAIATRDAPPRTAPTPVAAAPAAGDAPSELTLRDRVQRERIAQLEAELARTRSGPTALSGVMPARRPFDMAPGELAELAAQCRFPFDVPPTAGSTLMDNIIADGMRTAGLSDAEQSAVRRVIDAYQPAYQQELQQLYRELTGEDGALDPTTLVMEIEQKSPEKEVAAAYRRLSAERAGLPAPRADATPTVIERYLRFAIRSADAFERQLAAEVGASRARAFRRTWGMVDFAPACP